MQPGVRQVLLGTAFYPGAIVALDFVRGRYRVGAGSYSRADFAGLSGLTVTRASVGYAETVGGQLVQFPANAARITDKGLLVEEARTNKCTNTNVNPQSLTNVSTSGGGSVSATTSFVADAAALAAIGLTGNVFKLDNSAGDAIAAAVIAGTTGNTNAHVGSAYIRGGAGKLRTNSGAEGSTTFSSSTGFRRVTVAITPTLTTRQLVIEAGAGAIVYFILNVLEEGSFATSPIPVAGASATRAADVVSIAGLSVSTPATAVVDSMATVLSSTSSWRLAVDDGSEANRLLLYWRNGTTPTAFVAVSSVAQADAQTGAAPAAGAINRLAGRFATNDVKAQSDGSASATDTLATMPTGLTTLRLGSTSTGSNQNGSFYIRKALIYPSAFTDAQLIAATA